MPRKVGTLLPALCGAGLLLPALAPAARAWGGPEHAEITAGAIRLLPETTARLIAPEAAGLIRHYCEFPDQNWATYGAWGNGDALPFKPRLPDLRNEWEISYYCAWNPVTREGASYPHSPPAAYEAVPRHFLRAVESLRQGNLVEAARILGAAVHYVEDCASFGHLQPIHRGFYWDTHSRPLDAGPYQPVKLGDSPEEAAAAIAPRMEEMVALTERLIDPILAKQSMPLVEAKRLVATDPMHKEVLRAVITTRYASPQEWEDGAIACATAAARLCADLLHSALSFAPDPFPEPAANPTGTNLVFNPSFEESGDEGPAGWSIGWLDLKDRSGRAEWYRAGTHWDKPVKNGERSLLLLWAPEAGIEWRQSWRRAIPVRAGEIYRATAAVKARLTRGDAHLALAFFDGDYEPLPRIESAPAGATEVWTELRQEAEVPEGARWLRLFLHSDADGAVWFDEVAVERIR